MKIEDLGVDFQPRTKIVDINEPPVRQGGVKVKDVDELLDKLMNEAKLI
jgi:electron transfer flavoprotein beta subunit